jgi:hypothetical protein
MAAALSRQALPVFTRSLPIALGSMVIKVLPGRAMNGLPYAHERQPGSLPKCLQHAKHGTLQLTHQVRSDWPGLSSNRATSRPA